MPCYDKVWWVRHTLDESSPLLKDNEKILIKKNGCDHWPDQLNNYKSMQESVIDFQLIVSLIFPINHACTCLFMMFFMFNKRLYN